MRDIRRRGKRPRGARQGAVAGATAREVHGAWECSSVARASAGGSARAGADSGGGTLPNGTFRARRGGRQGADVQHLWRVSPRGLAHARAHARIRRLRGGMDLGSARRADACCDFGSRAHGTRDALLRSLRALRARWCHRGPSRRVYRLCRAPRALRAGGGPEGVRGGFDAGGARPPLRRPGAARARPHPQRAPPSHQVLTAVAVAAQSGGTAGLSQKRCR
mmetsp:Transcript_7922/g.26315  ORF Transcript_7922/g.26315 Transcript_7922/m.26315 type:complete len:221 (+) Transcript_7922:612-1274(+)